MKNSFTELWELIPNKGHKVWGAVEPRTNELNRLREVLELLCSVLWRLELVFEFGDFPKESMADYRKKRLECGKELPWAIWRDQRESLSIKFDGDQLLVKYRFRESSDDSFGYLIQSTLIADAAIRLQGIRDMLKTICKGKTSLVLDDVKEELFDDATNDIKSSVIDIRKQVTLLEALRHSYAQDRKSVV